MFKKIAIGVVIALACLWVAKKTQVVSYASTLISQGKERVREQIPRDWELVRVQQEIQNLDRDYRRLLGPIAEKMAAVKKLEREVATAKDNLQQQRDDLLALTKSVESGETLITCNSATYNLDQARVKLAKDVALFKKHDAHLTTKERLLEAEQKNLGATREQLDKLSSQKREFEIRVAQLEAEEAMLKLARIKTPMHTDRGRVADIKNTLDRIEFDQTVEQQKQVLHRQYGSKIGDAQPNVQVQASSLDLPAIREYLQSKNFGDGK